MADHLKCIFCMLQHVVVVQYTKQFVYWIPHPHKNVCRHQDIYPTVQITFIFIDFRVCDFAFAFKTQNAPCVSRFKRILCSDRFQFAF